MAHSSVKTNFNRLKIHEKQDFVSLYVLLNRKQLLTNTEWRGSLEYLAELSKRNVMFY